MMPPKVDVRNLIKFCCLFNALDRLKSATHQETLFGMSSLTNKVFDGHRVIMIPLDARHLLFYGKVLVFEGRDEEDTV